jgi:hypothetical protein
MKYVLRRITVAAVVVAALVLTLGCSDLVSFSFTETSQNITVEGSALGQLPVDNPFGEAIKLDIDLEQELEAQDATGAKSVHLEGLVLQITSDSDGENFNFLEELELFANADGLERKSVAFIDDVPRDTGRISLQTDSGIDLKPYVEEGMRLEAEARASSPDEDTVFQAIATIRVYLL